MPRSAGVYTAPASSWSPGVDGQAATTTDWNALLADLANALTQSIAYDGSSTVTALIPFASGISVPRGALSMPSVQIAGDPTTGFYSAGAGSMGVTCGGTLAMTFTASGVTSAVAFTAPALTSTGNTVLGGASSTVGAYGSAGTAQPTITGAKGGNAALGSLISALAAQGWVIDGTSA